MGAALCLNAQTFQEGFFLRGYNLAYQYNPAIVGNNNFIAAGQLSSSLQNNVGAGAFLYPTEEGLLTGFSSSIPTSTFLGNLPQTLHYHSDLNATLLAYGFWKGQAFHTLELNVRAVYGASLPKELFEFIKLGSSSDVTDLGDFHVGANLFIEMAYGYGRKINDWLSVGGRAKLLLPMYGANWDISRMDLTADQEQLSMKMRGDLYVTNHTGTMGTNDQGYWDLLQFDKRHKMGFIPSGVGLGIDLGVLFTPAEGLSISLSALDLGGMFWYYGNRATMGGSASFTGMNATYDMLNGDDITEMVKDIGMEFLSLMKPIGFSDTGHNWLKHSLHSQVNLGIKYEMPFYRRLAIGATGRYMGCDTLHYWEGRGGFEINPIDWLDIVADLGYGSRGAVFGLAAGVKIYRLHLTAAWQDGFGGTLPYGRTPIKPNFRNITVGLTFNL